MEGLRQDLKKNELTNLVQKKAYFFPVGLRSILSRNSQKRLWPDNSNFRVSTNISIFIIFR